MEGRGLISFLIFLLSLTSISAIQTLSSINDLKDKDFGHTFPRHGLLLLHWLANNIEIDNNDIIPLNFEPNRGDYGIHYYGNYDNLLPPIPEPSGTVVYSYYTLGNLNPNSLHNNAQAFPSYVTQGFYNYGQDRNRDRIIILVREDWRRINWNPRTIDRVYITQHYGQDQGRGSQYAKMCWDYIPDVLLKQGVMVVLFKNNTETKFMVSCFVRNCASGSFDTRVPLNPGLQVRLHKAVSHWFCSPTMGELIWKGPEFHDANGEVPRYVSGFEEASLQLFVHDGMACARLHIRKTFTDWKVKFYNSWVGFYSTKTKKTSEYSTWQWVTKFTRENRTDWADIPGYDVYVYHSHMAIAPGAQARFILKKSRTSEAIADTPDWESTLTHGNVANAFLSRDEL